MYDGYIQKEKWFKDANPILNGKESQKENKGIIDNNKNDKKIKREKTELYDPEDYINNRNPSCCAFC